MEKPRIATMILSCVVLFCGPGREGHGQTPSPGPITKSVIVLSLRSAAQAQRCSNATLLAEIFTDAKSLRAYYVENSYGLASISGTVSGPYTIAMGDTCDTDKYESAADAAASAAGVNLSAYDSTFYILPPESVTLGCGAGETRGIGSRVTKSWVREDLCDSKFGLGHEMGHAFGVRHSSISGTYVPPPVLSAKQTATRQLEYGDLSSVMGGIFDGLVEEPTYLSQFNETPHFAAPLKIHEGWLPEANVQTVTVSGSYRVALLEKALTDVQVLKVVAGTSTYYCSYRRAVGFDSILLDQYVDKTSVHTSNGPGRSTLYANLGDGQSYSNGQLTVTQVRHDATYAYVTISFP